MAALRQLGRDSLLYGILDVANRFAAFLLLPLYTRVLLPADYGRLDLAFTLTTVAIAGLTLGLDNALLFRFNETDDVGERRRIVTAATVACFLAMLSGALLLAALRVPLAAATLPGVPGGTRLVLLVAGALPLQGVNQIHMLLLRVRRDFTRYTILSLGTLLLLVGFNLAFLLVWHLGVEGVLLAQVLTRVPMAVYGFVVNRREFAPRLSPALSAGLVRYGAPLVLGNLSYWGLMYAERYALARLRPLSEVGIYGLATRVAMLVTLVSVAIDMAWMPFAHSIQRDPQAPRTYARALGWYLLGSGATGTVLAVFAREALVVMTTPAYYAAYVLVGPIMAALVVRGAVNMVGVGALVSQRTRLISEVAVATGLLDCLLLALLVPPLGGFGAALATFLARLAALGLLVFRLRKVYPVPYPWARIGKMAVVFGATVLGGVLLSRLGIWTGFALKLLLLLPAAGVACLAWGVVSRDEAAALLASLRARVARPRAVEGS
jgi:O-antigen/teichoic acid export membrane protein